MVWLLVVVLLMFGAVLLTGMGRVLLVFSGSGLLRVSGATVFVASVFVGLTAVFGGVTVAAGVDKFPTSWLTGTLFNSYLIPGLILTLVVGGSAVVAAAATLRSRERAALWSVLAGAILLGWLAGERIILPPAAFVRGWAGDAGAGDGGLVARAQEAMSVIVFGFLGVPHCPASAPSCRRVSRTSPRFASLELHGRRPQKADVCATWSPGDFKLRPALPAAPARHIKCRATRVAACQVAYT